MAKFEITAPNGKTLEIEGDTMPTEAELDEIFAQTNTNQPAKENRGIDLTPSGLVKQATSIPAAGLMTALQGGDFAENRQKALDTYEQFKPLRGATDFAFDTYAYSQLPVLRGATGANALAKAGTFAGNAAIQGGVPGLLEGLKEGKPLEGATLGSSIAAGLQGAAPIFRGVSKLGNKLFLNAFPGLQENTVKQLIKPDSTALDMTKDQADRLAQDTTERLRNAYDNFVEKRGNEVENQVSKLRGLDKRVDVGSLENDITSTFDQYGGDLINPARNMTGKLEQNLIDLVDSGSLPLPEVKPEVLEKINPEMINTMSPIDLEKSKQQIGKMIDWDDKVASNYQNPILEQIYGKFNDRLSSLSPNLADANAAYEKARAFGSSKKSRLRTILNPNSSLETATSKLKNYKATNDDIFELENILQAEGNAPFLNKIDDVNAANELLDQIKTGFNPLGAADWLKNVVERPVLKGIRGLNRNQNIQNIGNLYRNINKQIPESVRRLLVPLSVKATAPMLYGGVSNVEDY